MGLKNETEEAAAFVLGLRARGLRDLAVLGAMERLPREAFAPSRFADLSRSDVALPLPLGQTMTAPGAVAAMLTALAVEPDQRVFEVGTGSGYVSALLARLGARVHTVERYAALADGAAVRFGDLGFARSIQIEVGDGLDVPPGLTLFPRILLNGALPEIPERVLKLLAPGGRLVGALTIEGFPRLVTVTRDEDGDYAEEAGAAIRIAPLVWRGALAPQPAQRG